MCPAAHNSHETQSEPYSRLQMPEALHVTICDPASRKSASNSVLFLLVQKVTQGERVGN